MLSYELEIISYKIRINFKIFGNFIEHLYKQNHITVGYVSHMFRIYTRLESKESCLYSRFLLINNPK